MDVFINRAESFKSKSLWIYKSEKLWAEKLLRELLPSRKQTFDRSKLKKVTGKNKTVSVLLLSELRLNVHIALRYILPYFLLFHLAWYPGQVPLSLGIFRNIIFNDSSFYHSSYKRTLMYLTFLPLDIWDTLNSLEL